jgi:GT2 family glycosyltransferase/SAM-dependent methyltransferase
MSLERLVTLFFAHDGNVVDKWEQYLSIYASEFARFLKEGKTVRMLEIGVQNGGSLEVWAKYLPAGSEIVGLDIDPAVEKIHFDRPIKVVVADVNDIERRELLLGAEPFDIIIDDGSHRSDDIVQAFRSLFDKLQPGGVYIVEDLHASYWDGLGGGFRRPGSAIEFFKDTVDSLAIDYFETNAKISTVELEELQRFGRWIDRVVFYDSVVVIQKRLFAKTTPYRRLLSGVTSAVTNPAAELLTAPPAMVRELRLGPATSQVLHEELLTRLISELKVQGDLKASIEALRVQLKAQTTEHGLNLELVRTETDDIRREAARISDELSMNAAERKTLQATIEQLSSAHQSISLDMNAAERKTLQATIERLSSAHQSILLALVHTNAERDALLQKATWGFSPLSDGYRFMKDSERFIRHRLRASRPAPKVLEATPAQSTGTVDPEQLIRRSDLFDSEWYLRQLPTATTIANAIRHYIAWGAAEGLDPHPLFDASWYAEQYLLEPGTNPLVHYLVHGAARGLDPNPLFDTSWYLERYRDVRDSGADPLVHYLKHGAAEGRDPNPFFSSRWYLEQNEDVERAKINPLRHYLHHGDAEGRDPSAGFSIRWYREKYLKEEDGRDINALDHYIQFGKEAGYEPRSPNADYLLEILKQEQAFAATLPEIEQHISAMVIKPLFLILIPGGSANSRKETERSLQTQVYPAYLIVESLFAVPEEEQETEASPRFFIELSAGYLMHNSALYSLASAINADPMVDIIYADDDSIDNRGIRSRPFFKPDWSPDYLESMNYIGSSACVRWNIVQPLLQQGSSGYDLILRLTELTKNIGHVRQILFHRTDVETSCSSEGVNHDVEALEERLRRTGRAGEVRPILPDCRCYDVKIHLTAKPLVSVIIPTAGKNVDLDGRSIDLLVNCLDTIASRSTYKHLEFIIVDNGDLNPTQRDHLRNYGAKSITFREPDFNVAKKLNLGASIATGELLLLLNDDVEPLVPDWIERLVEHFEKPHVGVVGAKLLYNDGTTQHVGVVLNSCNPDHVRRFKPRDDLGYYFSAAAARNFIAVTGACMMTRASLFRTIGGYCESLAISYNDTDYCLRVIESGHTIVYAPRSELVHFESQSRVAALEMDEVKYFHKRWSRLVSDPFYNELELTVASPTFEVKHNRRFI